MSTNPNPNPNSYPPTSPPKPKEPPVTPPSKDRSHTRSKSTTLTTPTTTLPFHHRRHPSQPSPACRFTTDAIGALHHDNTVHIDTDSPLHFSPSKARAAAQATHQLSILKRWLSSLSDPPGSAPTPASSLPAVSSSTGLTQLVSRWEAEHRILATTNPELAALTVQWLQETMGANRLADERRRLVFEAKKAEVDGLERSRSQLDSSPVEPLGVLEELCASLTPVAQGHLDSLASTSILLGRMPESRTEEPLVHELGRAVMEHTLQAQDVQTNVESLEALLRELEGQCEDAKSQLAELEKERKAAVREAEVMNPQTAQWSRETKQIAIKIKEYKDRVAALERSRPVLRGSHGDVVRVEDVIKMQETVKVRREHVKELEHRLSLLHGLPPNLEASRDEVRRAKLELERLKAQREDLFGTLADT